MINKVDKGKIAQEKACEYLQKKGFHILKTNFKFGKGGEIDIIADDNDTLVFVEVRSKHNPNTYDPIWSMTPRKISSFKRACEGFLYINNVSDKLCRIDFVKVDLSVQPFIIEYIENAF